MTIDIRKAYYIKLGAKGAWEKSCLDENKLRIGWVDQSLEEINRGDWEALKAKYAGSYPSHGAASMDFNALKRIVESTSDDVWITFHRSQLYWCRVGEPGIFEDDTSRYRKVDCWRNQDIKGHPLLISQIPGSISKIQRFQATVCAVEDISGLSRLLNDRPSPTFQAISAAKGELVKQVEQGLKPLHWKDFEILVDLVFRNAGWRRKSVIGESVKDVDLALEEPITGEQYQVQVKTAATVGDFEEFEKYALQFPPGIFRRFYFVAHSPDSRLTHYHSTVDGVELILSERLAQMVVDSGLTDWLLNKVK